MENQSVPLGAVNGKMKETMSPVASNLSSLANPKKGQNTEALMTMNQNLINKQK